MRVSTRARFWQQSAQHRGIDLLKVRQQLEVSIDDSLAEEIQGDPRAATMLAAIILPVAVALQTWLIRKPAS